MTEMTYLRAISDGLRTEMRSDERVLMMGEDIGVFGSAFKVTDGLFDEFGADRVMDTPLAESGIIGCAIGAAVVGMRPVCEMQFSDFIACGFDQLINVAAKMYYRQRLPVNITVRLPSGGGFSGGPFHSQNPEAWFMRSPGIKVVAPSTAEDAKGLIIASMRDPNPVVFMEHKNLHRRVKGEVPEGSYETPFRARVAREGEDLVVITYGAMVHTALEATADIPTTLNDRAARFHPTAHISCTLHKPSISQLGKSTRLVGKISVGPARAGDWSSIHESQSLSHVRGGVRTAPQRLPRQQPVPGRQAHPARASRLRDRRTSQVRGLQAAFLAGQSTARRSFPIAALLVHRRC
jgi:2-oxoisovalerate dehydrogenase E1 component beta subunit